MLGKTATARFASHHSPERERREVGFAVNRGTIPTPEEAAEQARIQAEGIAGKEAGEQTERQKKGVESVSDETKESVQEMLEDEAATSGSLLDKAKEVQALITEIEELPQKQFRTVEGKMTTMGDFIRAHAPPEHVKILEENMTFVHHHAGEIHKTVSTVQTIHDWYAGDIPPREFIEHLREIYKAAGNEAEFTQRIEPHIQTYLREHADQVDAWELLRHTGAGETFVRDIGKIAALDVQMKIADEQMNRWKAGFEGHKKYMEETAAKGAGEQKIEAHVAGHGVMATLLGNVKFYSLTEIWDAFKKVGHAYKHAWDERFELKATTLAKGLGTAIPGWTPFAGEVKLNLDKAAESVNNKETQEFVEYLKKRNFNFKNLFIDEHGDAAMHHNQHEPNKARAILEYAAGRGWLYDISLQKGKDGKKILGYNFDALLSDWTEEQRSNYFIKLVGMQTGGTDAEVKAGKSREQTTDSADLFVQAIDKELSEYNFWGAIGVTERAIERGLAGEIGPWIATRFLRLLREDATARRLVPREVFDQMGIKGFNRASAFTLAYFKWDRKKVFDPWVKKHDPKIEEAGDLGRAIGMIEREIMEKTDRKFETEEEKKELDRTVAQVLAAKTVEVTTKKGEKKFVTIWSDKYKFYHTGPGKQSDTSPGKEDPDYYTEVSDVILCDRPVLETVLLLTGSGVFKEHDRAIPFIERLLELHEQMIENAKDPAKRELADAGKNFLKVTREKLDSWFETWANEARGGPGAKESLISGKLNGEPAILQLALHDLISFELIEARGKTASGNDRLAVQLLIQLADDKANKTRPDLRARAWAALPDKVRQEFDNYRVTPAKSRESTE